MGRTRRAGVVLTFVACVAGWLLVARGARAAPSADDAVNDVVQHVLSEEYATAAFNTARTKLQAALARCKTARCSGATRAQVYVLLGMISSQLGQRDDAISSFVNGLRENSGAKLLNMGTPDIRSAFAEAQKITGVAGAAPAPPVPATPAPPVAPSPTPPPTPAPTAPAPPTPAPAPPTAPSSAPPSAPPPTPPPADDASAPPGDTSAAGSSKPHGIAGWDSPEAFELASAAVAADQVGKLEVCIEKNRASLKIEEQPRTRLHLSSCETRAGHLIDALGDAQKALKAGIEHRDAPVMRAARNRVSDLLRRIPHVTFVPPPGATDLNVTFDDRLVPNDALTRKFSVDPGTHKVHAEGVIEGAPLAFDKDYDVKESDLVSIEILLVSQRPEYLTESQIKCMLSAKSQEDVLKCIPARTKNLVVKAGTEVNGYADTDHVDVFSPTINASVISPTSGWNVGGLFLIDVVSAASPDIVSEASPPFHEIRYAGTVTGGYKPGRYGAQGVFNVSDEPDYLSIGGGVAVVGDLRDKLITPRIAYSHRHDEIRLTKDTSLHHDLEVNVFEAGGTFILSPTSLVLANLSLQTERGDQSKPYRYVPMFDPWVTSRVPIGASVDLVNAYRLPMRPQEQLPLARDRYALGARFVSRLPFGTLRVEQRLYHDTWDQNATTTDLQYVMDFGRRFHAWPHVRFNAQSGANFYRLAYTSLVQNGTVVLPTYRTTSRELAPSVAGTVGAGSRFSLTSPEARTQYSLFAQGDILLSHYLDSLFVTKSTAFYGTLGFDTEFQ